MHLYIKDKQTIRNEENDGAVEQQTKTMLPGFFNNLLKRGNHFFHLMPAFLTEFVTEDAGIAAT